MLYMYVYIPRYSILTRFHKILPRPSKIFEDLTSEILFLLREDKIQYDLQATVCNIIMNECF